VGFFSPIEPTCSFYVFAGVRKFCKDSQKDDFRLTEERKAGVTPGVDFGRGGQGFRRLFSAASMDDTRHGLEGRSVIWLNIFLAVFGKLQSSFIQSMQLSGL